jgi:hypothetical protein
MLGRRPGHKVNFCKFTINGLAIEDASESARYTQAHQQELRRRRYELAATDYIMIVDDRRSTVCCRTPPGSSSRLLLARAFRQTQVRRDRAVSSIRRRVRPQGRWWRLVDEVVPPSKWKDASRSC